MDLSQMQVLEGNEILNVIHKAALFGGVIFQLGTIKMQTCSVQRIEIKDGLVTMLLLGEHGLDETHTLCVNFAFRNFTFRVPANQFTIEGNVITCAIPVEAKAIPARPGGERHILPFDVHATADLFRIEKRDAFCDFQVKLVDISRWGMGAYILGNSEGTLVQYDHVRIQDINGIKLSEPIYARIEYVNQRKYRDNATVYRIGLSLEKKFPEEIYLSIVNLCRLTLSA